MRLVMRLVFSLAALASLALSQVHATELFNQPRSAEQLLTGPLAQPAAALRDAQVMRGQFTYRKFLKEIPQPLVSRGDFVLIKGNGINWHTRQPFDTEFVLTSAGIKQFDAGKATGSGMGGEQPAVREVARIFLALMSLDLSALQQSFALYGTQSSSPNSQPGRWQVGMKPKSAAVAAVFTSAVLEGEAQVESLVLTDAGGDRTEILFTGLQYAAVASAADRQALKP